MLIKESTLRRIIREEAVRALREADDYTIPITKAPEGNADIGPVTKTWDEGGYKYSYNPGNDQMFIVSGPKMTAPTQVTKASNPKAYYAILNQYEDLMGLPKTAPAPAAAAAAPAGLSNENEIREMIGRVKNSKAGTVQAIWDSVLKQDETARGKWTVSFTIKTDGTVKNAKATPTQGTFPRQAFEANLAKTVGLWTFAALAEEQEVSFTYTFGVGY